MPSSLISDQVQNHPYRRYVCTSCGSTHDAPVYCGNRFCTVCSRPRAAKCSLKIQYILKSVPPIPRFTWRHITLTISSVSDIDSGAKTIIAHFRKLRQRAFWKRLVSCGITALEVTGKPDAWHVHLHILAYSRYVPHPLLMKHWRDISGDFVVWITRPPFAVLHSHISKYANKPSNKAVQEAFNSGRHLRNSRLYQTFGRCPSVPPELTNPKQPCKKCGATGSWFPEDRLYILGIHAKDEPMTAYYFPLPPAA